jgi:hypothetical protein
MIWMCSSAPPVARQFRRRYADLLQLIGKDLTGMNRWTGHGCSSMVVHDLDVGRPGSSTWPLEADPPLLVDPDAVLTFSVAFQGLEAIASDVPQVLQAVCRVQDLQPAPRSARKAVKGGHRDPIERLRSVPRIMADSKYFMT